MKPLALAVRLSCLSTALFVAVIIFAVSPAFAQDYSSRIDKSKVAATGAKVSDFVPAGWKIESEARGDVNGDGRADDVLTVEEEKAAEGKQRGRALIVLTAQADGNWKNAAVADRLLQCADCGGGMARP